MSRFLAWVTSLLLLFLVLEGLTRLLTNAPATEPDARLAWRYKQNVHLTRSTDGAPWELRTNSGRLRAPEGHGAGVKPAGSLRVLLLGDSFTMGWGLPADETFAARLEALCAVKGQAVTVIPAGTEGYTTDQECLWLEENVKTYAPDVVVVCPYANDVVGNALSKYLATNKPYFALDAQGNVAGDPAPVVDARPFYLRWSRLLSTLNSVRLAFGARVEVPAECGGGKLQLDDFPFLRTEPETLKGGWRATQAIAKRLVVKAKEAGVKTVLAAPIPNRFEIHAEDTFVFQRDAGCAPGALDFSVVTGKLGEVFQAAGATVVDARSALTASAAAGQRLYFHRDWHFNRDGAKVFAEVLHQGLTNAGALPPGGAPLAGPTPLSAAGHGASPGGIPTWAFVVAGLWVVLTGLFKLSYPDEGIAGAAVKVGILLAFVVGVFAGIHVLTTLLNPMLRFLLIVGIVGGILIYAIVKTRSRFGTIRELFGALVDRGHWYMVPMLVVMLTISVLLVVAQNPIVAPFIYTLF
jgi:hypothetical protein